MSNPMDEAFQSDTLTLDAETLTQWWNPAAQSEDEKEQIEQMLEALFAVPGEEEKRDFPHELSALIKTIFGASRLLYVLNAGDGSIATGFDPAFTYGIEPEEKRSRKRQGRYNSIVGDLPRVSKLMEPIGAQLADTIAVLRKGVDVDTTIDFLNANQDEKCHVVYVFNTEDVPEGTEFPGLYCKIETPEITAMFCTDPDMLKSMEDGQEMPSRKTTVDTLDLLGPWVEEQKRVRLSRSEYRYGNTNQSQSVSAAWKAIHREFGRRYVREDKTYDIELFGKNVMNYMPSDWCKLAIGNNHHVGNLGSRIHNRAVNHFAQMTGLWRELLIMVDENVLLIDPAVIEAVNPIIAAAEQVTTPLRPLKPQERLGYLSRQSKMKCIVGDEEAGFEAGKWYSVSQRPEEYSKIFHKSEPFKGVMRAVRKKRRYYHQRINIAGHSYFDDDPMDIKYILKHFDVPDPGSLQDRYPELVEAERERYDKIEELYLKPRDLALKPYQKTDLAALSVNNRGISAWQQGLGKTWKGIAFALNAALKESKDEGVPTLIVCPQDLIPQWQAEAKNRYGIELHWIGRHKGTGGTEAKSVGVNGEEVNISGGAIRNLIEARNIAKALKGGETGFYITHYEALTMGGARNLVKIEEPYTIRIEKEQKFVPGGYRTVDGETEWFEAEYQEVEHEITSAQECPKCGGEMFGALTCERNVRSHPSDLKARRCGWTRYSYRLPSIGKVLATAFKRGVIVVDEGTQIASARNSSEKDSSQKTKAVCGLRAKYRLVMSGTPVKNFIAQAFWLLWWGIGGSATAANSRFPYAYNGGKAEFAKDYTVLEWTYNEETGNWSKVKEVGEVTNHTQLWAQLASCLLRRVKEETGELIVKKQVHPVYAPLGVYQREQMDAWINHFPEFFAEKHPDDPKVKRGSHRQMAPMLGLDVKLNYASVLPLTDVDAGWTEVPVSNYTPAAYKALTTIMALVKQGRPVLVGTDIKKASGWLASALTEKGVVTRTMLKSNGSGDTLDPADRAKVVKEFQDGAMAVLCSTQKAIRLGHNLDKGSAVVLLGLDWDYETFAQFTERVHRLTSTHPVDIYVVISGEENRTMLGRKWDVIQDKAKGASMALDGYLPDQNEEPVDIAEIVREMMENGIPATGSEVEEAKIVAAWQKVPQIEQFVIPEDFALNQAKPWIIDWPEANKAYDEWLTEYQAAVDLYEAEEAEIAAANEAALGEFLMGVVDKQLGESLDAFFAGATAPLEIVADDTMSSDGEILPESGATAPEGEVEADPAERTGDVPVSLPAPSDSSVIEGQLELVVDSSSGSEETAPPAPSLDVMGQIKEAKELHELGILTDDEFAQAKADLLALLKQGKGAVA